LQAVPEGGNTGLSFRILFRKVHEYSDSPYAVALLRACRKRPCDSRAADELDNLASLHLHPQAHRYRTGLKQSWERVV
jgi:hypothetical protein